MSITKGVNECIWLHNLIHSLDLKVDKLILFCDSHSASCLVKYPIYHLKTKHIDVRLNLIWNVLKEERFSIQMIDTKENLVHVRLNFIWNVLGTDHVLDKVSICTWSIYITTASYGFNYTVSSLRIKILLLCGRMLHWPNHIKYYVFVCARVCILFSFILDTKNS